MRTVFERPDHARAAAKILAEAKAKGLLNERTNLRSRNVPPAIVRIRVPEGRTISYGSGALVFAGEELGLVLTNWHVVRDCTGDIKVYFPGGFSSKGRLVKSDALWDLAAVLVWLPKKEVEPLTIATEPPERGAKLSIAGYGERRYREKSGVLLQYVAPARNASFDLIEMAVWARQGDSGGPILNEQREMAGILFGTADGRTTGSNCVQLKKFLDATLAEYDDLTEWLGK